MKLRNKKTGEVGYPYFQNWKEISCVIVDENAIQIAEYKSLAELNAEWEDYEEAKEHYFITEYGEVYSLNEYEGLNNVANPEDYKSIGNYFDTKAEAEKAVEKLKAWKRLKDKGFRFTLVPGVGALDVDPGKFQIDISADMPEKWFCCDAVQKDLDLLFGGEE